jgi:hypothetical protein
MESSGLQELEQIPGAGYTIARDMPHAIRCPLYAVRCPLSEIRATSDEILSTNLAPSY